MENEYFIGYLANNEVVEFYNKTCSDLHQEFGISNLAEQIPPHITLKPPFRIDSVKHLEEYLETNVLTNIEKFDFEVSDFNFLEGKRMTIVLSPRGDLLFEKLRTISGILNEFSIKNDLFVENLKPHMTIGRFISQEQFLEIWSYVQKLPKPNFNVTFDNLTIFEKNEKEKWVVYKTFFIS